MFLRDVPFAMCGSRKSFYLCDFVGDSPKEFSDLEPGPYIIWVKPHGCSDIEKRKSRSHKFQIE